MAEVVVNMIPILFDKSEEKFNSNGIGRLTEATSCIVIEERNGIYELEMKYPVTGRLYQEIKNAYLIYAIPHDGGTGQLFRIYKISRPLGGIITVYAEHISYMLSHIPVEPFIANSVGAALQGLGNNAVEECPFSFWTDKLTEATFRVEEPISIRSLLGGMEGSIIDIYGGEYEFDNFIVKLHQERGSCTGATIRYGKNLTDVKQEESIENTITGIYPYWSDSDGAIIELPEKVVYSDNAANFPYPRTIPKKFEFEEKPSIQQLRATANQYIESNGIGTPDISITVKFQPLWQTEEYKNIEPLERVRLCDTIIIDYEELNIHAEAKVNKTTYDTLNEKYISIDLGNARNTLVKTIMEYEKKLEEKPTINFLEKAIISATEQITGVKGGYIVFRYDANEKPYEMLVMDTDNIETAVNVWRFNQAGIGHSKTGYNGPYGTAITQDGSIVADYMTTGTLYANLIKAGILSDIKGMNSWNLETGELLISSSSNIGQQVSEISKSLDTISIKVQQIESEMNGEIVIYFVDKIPTLNNEPAINWHIPLKIPFILDNNAKLAVYTEAEYNKHLTAVCYVADGNTYRFERNSDGTYGWNIIPNTELTAILKQISELKVTSDSISAEVGRVETELKDGYYTKTESDSKLEVKANAITAEVKKTYQTKSAAEEEIGELESKIEQTAESITNTVKASYQTKSAALTSQKNLESQITQTASKIESTVSATYQTKSAAATTTQSLQSKITQTAEKIETKVTKGDVSSQISQEAGLIKLKANRFELQSQYTEINQYGVIKTSHLEAVNAELSGMVKASSGNVGILHIGSDYLITSDYGFQINKQTAGKYSVSADAGFFDDSLTCTGDSTIQKLRVTNSLNVYGTKNRIVKTKDYGNVAMNAVESAQALFMDNGSGIIDNTGKCYIAINDKFAQTINETGYQVHVTQTNVKKIKYTIKQEGFFIIYGTPGATFDFIILAKQAGYEDLYAEQIEAEESNIKYNMEIFNAERELERSALEYIENYEKEI